MHPRSATRPAEPGSEAGCLNRPAVAAGDWKEHRIYTQIAATIEPQWKIFNHLLNTTIICPARYSVCLGLPAYSGKPIGRQNRSRPAPSRSGVRCLDTCLYAFLSSGLISFAAFITFTNTTPSESSGLITTAETISSYNTSEKQKARSVIQG